MNIETKVIDAYGMSCEGSKEDYLNFGWKHTEDTQVHIGRGFKPAYVLARDTDMPNYKSITQLENEYFHLKRTKKTYVPMEGLNVLLAFLCLIVPGIIYVALKLNQKKRIREHNAEIQKQMNAVVVKAKALL